MNTIIPRLTEYETDIKLLKNAILVLEKTFTKIKKDIIETHTKESNNINLNEGKNKKKEKRTNICKNKKTNHNNKLKQNTTFKKCSIILNNNIMKLFSINTGNNKILVSEFNIIINKYLTENDLIKDKKVHLNKELKLILKTKKRIIELDEILYFIIKCNVG